MIITPIKFVNNISFCQKNSSSEQKVLDIIEKKDSIDLFLDAYGALINKISENETEIQKLEETISKTNIPQQKEIIHTKINLIKKNLKTLQKNRIKMERIIYIINNFTQTNNPIEIEYIDKTNEDL